MKPDYRATILTLQEKAVKRLAKDLASIFNRAFEMSIAICPDVDEDGVEYSVEATRWSADIRWDPVVDRWVVARVREHGGPPEGPGEPVFCMNRRPHERHIWYNSGAEVSCEGCPE